MGFLGIQIGAISRKQTGWAGRVCPKIEPGLGTKKSPQCETLLYEKNYIYSQVCHGLRRDPNSVGVDRLCGEPGGRPVDNSTATQLDHKQRVHLQR